MGLLTKLRNLQKAYADWKEQRFLKKHGCKTRRDYDRAFDPDYNPFCDRIEDMYRGGYSYLVEYEPWAHKPWTGSDRLLDSIAEIMEWCYSNCEAKFRCDWHRVIEDWDGRYVQNGIGGRDIFFLAFYSEKDVMMFNLRWL